MRVLVLGGSGFIGTTFVADLLDAGHEVLNLDKVRPRNELHTSYFRYADVLDGVGLSQIASDYSPTHVVHLAARTDLRGLSSESYDANVRGTGNVLNACMAVKNLERLVFASSMLVCRNGYIPRNDTDYCPNTLYGQSKVSGERLVRGCRELAGRWTIVRPTSIWGPWFGPPYFSFFLSVSEGRYWHPGPDAPAKAFGYVGNTTHQITKLLAAPAESVAGRTFYLADDPAYSIRAFATAVQRELRTKPVRQLPVWLLRTAAVVGDATVRLGWKNAPLTSFRLSNMLTGSQFDLLELNRITGKQRFGLVEGVSQTVQWLRSSGAIQ